LSLDHVWISAQGRAVLLDEPWPLVEARAQLIPVGDDAGRQRFLSYVGACAESTSVPLHARPVLQNLEKGKFEKLSFLTGTLRGMLDRPAEVSRGIRAGAIFMLPLYVSILIFIGYFRGDERSPETMWDSAGWIALAIVLLVLGASALIQLLELPFSTTASHAIFRLALVNKKGEPAGIFEMLIRWAIVWLPLILPMLFVAFLLQRSANTAALIAAAGLFLLWIGAAVYAVIHPSRGLHDRLAGTWVVRR
jgi:hypothetical protein